MVVIKTFLLAKAVIEKLRIKKMRPLADANSLI